MCGSPRPCPPYSYHVIKDNTGYDEYYKDTAKISSFDSEKEYHKNLKKIKGEDAELDGWKHTQKLHTHSLPDSHTHTWTEKGE